MSIDFLKYQNDFSFSFVEIKYKFKNEGNLHIFEEKITKIIANLCNFSRFISSISACLEFFSRPSDLFVKLNISIFLHCLFITPKVLTLLEGQNLRRVVKKDL